MPLRWRIVLKIGIEEPVDSVDQEKPVVVNRRRPPDFNVVNRNPTIGARRCDDQGVVIEQRRDLGAGGEQSEALRRQREGGEVEFKEIERRLARFSERRVGWSEYGERRVLGKKGLGEDFESERHGDVAGIGENISGVEDSFLGERGGEGEEKEGEEEEEED